MEFAEYPCDKKENKKRGRKGRIPVGFMCAQLHTKRWIYKDVYDNDIEVKVPYNAGCELRCAENCDSLL